MISGCTCRVGKCSWVEQYFWRVMEIHYLFPFVEQRLDKCVFCRRAQQRWCLLTFSHGLDNGTWEVDCLHCSPLAAVSCLSFMDAVIGHIFFSPLPFPPHRQILQRVTPICFNSAVVFLSTLHNRHIVSCLYLRRQWKKFSTFTLAIHFTSACLHKMSLFPTYLYLSQNEVGCDLGIA